MFYLLCKKVMDCCGLLYNPHKKCYVFLSIWFGFDNDDQLLYSSWTMFRGMVLVGHRNMNEMGHAFFRL